MNTSKTFLVYVLVNFGATSVFINKAFVDKHCLNICKLFFLVLVYNMDRTLNEIGQISKMVNIVLQYKTHVEKTLLVVQSLSKQDLILEFI